MAGIEKIDSQLLGIGKLLQQSRFSVPPHQRPYAWEEDQIDDLYKDIQEAKSSKSGDSYFLGTIVLAGGSGDRDSIIDGQQRILTCTILIAAIRDYFANKKQSDRAADITRDYLSKRDIKTQEEETYIQVAPEDRDFFLKRVILLPDNSDRSIAPANISQKRLERAINLAQKFVDGIVTTTKDADDALVDLIYFLRDKAIVISVKVSDEANAFIIFEVLNDRGLDLTVADLLKNYVFRVAGDRISEVQTSWTKMSTAITEVAEEPDIRSFIRQAWISENGLTREKQLYDAIKKHIGNSKAKSVAYAKKLSEQSVIYAALGNTSHEKWKEYDDSVSEALDVFSNVGVTQVRPLLMSIFREFEVKEVNRSIPMIVAWTVRFLVCGSGGSGTLETYYSAQAKEVSNKNIRTANQLYKAMQSVLPSDARFQDEFSKVNSGKSWIAKFYLRVLEEQKRAGVSELVVNPDKGKVNLEHVLPQSHNSTNWPQFTADEHRIYVKRLGNLCLLNRKLNGTIANSGFNTKQPVLSGSALELTKEIGACAQWTVSEIEQRQARLALLAVSAWPNAPKT